MKDLLSAKSVKRRRIIRRVVDVWFVLAGLFFAVVLPLTWINYPDSGIRVTSSFVITVAAFFMVRSSRKTEDSSLDLLRRL